MHSIQFNNDFLYVKRNHLPAFLANLPFQNTIENQLANISRNLQSASFFDKLQKIPLYLDRLFNRCASWKDPEIYKVVKPWVQQELWLEVQTNIELERDEFVLTEMLFQLSCTAKEFLITFFSDDFRLSCQGLFFLFVLHPTLEFLYSHNEISDDHIGKLIPYLEVFVAKIKSSAKTAFPKARLEGLLFCLKQSVMIQEALKISNREALSFALYSLGELPQTRAAQPMILAIYKANLAADEKGLHALREFILMCYQQKGNSFDVQCGLLYALLCIRDGFQSILSCFFSEKISYTGLIRQLEQFWNESREIPFFSQVGSFLNVSALIGKTFKRQAGQDLELYQLSAVIHHAELYFEWGQDISYDRLSDTPFLKPFYHDFLKGLTASIFSRANIMQDFDSVLNLPLDREDISLLESLIVNDKQHAEDAGFKAILKVFRRYEQVKKIAGLPFEKEALSPLDEIRMAFSMESEIIKVKKATGSHFLGICRTDDSRNMMQVDFTKKVMYLSANVKKSVFMEEGAYKIAVKVVRIPFKRTHPVATFIRTFTQTDINSKAYKETEEEIALLEKYKNKRGIVTLLHHCIFFYDTEDVKKGLSLIFEEYDGGMEKVKHREISLSIEEMFSAVIDIIYGLYALHKDGRLHGDVKPRNMLVKKTDPVTQTVKAALCDLGFSFLVSLLVGNNYEAKGHYDDGYYGTIYYTAPELFGERCFQGDHFKVELFALGVSMYELRFGQRPPWCEIIDAQYEENFDEANNCHFDQTVLDQARSKVLESLSEEVWDSAEVQGLFLKKQNGDTLSTQERYDWLMYQLLQPCDSRITLPEVINFISA